MANTVEPAAAARPHAVSRAAAVLSVNLARGATNVSAAAGDAGILDINDRRCADKLHDLRERFAPHDIAPPEHMPDMLAGGLPSRRIVLSLWSMAKAIEKEVPGANPFDFLWRDGGAMRVALGDIEKVTTDVVIRAKRLFNEEIQGLRAAAAAASAASAAIAPPPAPGPGGEEGEEEIEAGRANNSVST